MSTTTTQKSKHTVGNNQRVQYNNRIKSSVKQNTSFALPLLESLMNQKSDKKINLGLSIIEEALRDDDGICLIQRAVRKHQAGRRQKMESQENHEVTSPNFHSRQPELQQTNNDDSQKSEYLQQKLSNKRPAFPSLCDNNIESPPLRKKTKVVGTSLDAVTVPVTKNYNSDPSRSSWSQSKMSQSSSKVANRSSFGQREHWLWRSLRAYSIAERKSVARLLLSSVSTQATKPISVTDSNETKVEFVSAYFRRKQLRNRLSKKILQLFDNYVNSKQNDCLSSHVGERDIIHKTYFDKVAVSNGVGCSKSRLAIEWVAILDVLWMPSSEFIGNAESQGSNPDASTAIGSYLPFTQSDARVHWSWLTRSIWNCARNVRKQFSNTIITSEASDNAVVLSSLSYLALTLAVRREFYVPHSNNVVTSNNNNKSKDSSQSSTLPGVANNNKKSSNSSRQRSNSNNSLRSNDNSITAADVPKGVNPSNLLSSKLTKNNLSHVVDDGQKLLKSLQAFNSTLLWTIEESEQGVDDLSPLACLIGAYWITRDIVDHSSMSSTFSKNSNALSSIESSSCAREYCGGGNSLLSSGGGGSAAFVALQRAVHTLEQLVCFSKECEVVVVESKDDKKENSKSNKNGVQSSKRKSSSEKRARTSSISSNSKSRSRQNSRDISNADENELEEGDDEDEEMDEDEDDIEIEAAELEEEEEDDDEAHTEKNSGDNDRDLNRTSTETTNTGQNGASYNPEDDDQDANNGDKPRVPNETSGDEGHAEAVDEADEDDEDDEEGDEDHEEEEGSRIPDEEDEDIESIDHDEEEEEEEEEDDGGEGGEDGAADEEEETDEQADDVCRLHPLGTEPQFSSHEVEVDEGDDDDDDDDDDEADIDDDDEGDDVDGMDLDELTAAVENANADITLRNSSMEKQKNDQSCASSVKLSPPLDERKLTYVKACIQVLAFHHPTSQQNLHNLGFHQTSFLSISAEDAMLGMINDIVKPPKKPLNGKIIMRRAPTQEEFFRGSLSRNPISMSSLKTSVGGNSGGGRRSIDNGGTFSNVDDEPTVCDLRQHIANDLQMADSAELIEIIVANKILDVSLKLRVVHQVLWKNHLIENSAAASGTSASGFGSGSSGASYFASAGSAISMIFTSNSGNSERNGGPRITSDTPFSALPPMVATYRLAGVDGEATEDTVHPGDLVDPDEPSGSASSAEIEQLLENEFGITRLATNDRGVYVLLRSVQNTVYDFLRRIRRDDVLCEENQNPSRLKFKRSPPCQALILLRHCARLAANRKKLLQARAPTALLTLLLDVLKTVEESASSSDSVLRSSPTSDILQELIEVLTSDISSSTDVEDSNSDFASLAYDQDITSMPMLLESIETISLSAPLRNVIAKLLPFLTYGQTELSRELAQRFNTHIVVENLATYEDDSSLSTDRGTILMNTFVQTALSLQTNNVCNTLRVELLNCGFHERLIGFIMRNMPSLPPPWSAALHGKGESLDSQKINTQVAAGAWREFYMRGGLKTAFKMITVICIKHNSAQTRIAKMSDFLRSCHWIETTSDNSTYNVETKGLGLLAETFLDEISEGNDFVRKQVDSLRKKTRMRKKELAESRRVLALSKLTNYGTSSGTSSEPSQPQATSRIGLASILTPVVELFRDSKSDKLGKGKTTLEKEKTEKPAWLAEAEMMEDEQGLTCAVCQEGRTLQPSEVLGLYAFVKKVAIPLEQCGSRASIDGTNLLRALPSSMPDSLLDSHVANEWFPIAKATAEEAARSPTSSLTVSATGGRRNSIFTTTVSAGNGIHITCHRKARQADRSHPKAPKSEWEGASLRNNRCNCNVILPLVSSRSAKVPLMAVDAALTDHQSAVSNLLGSNPKSMLWTVLHDIRFLLLRMAYGEALNADCGGGSLVSNCKLLFYQMLMADMFDHDAQVDQPQLSHHARGLSAALLTGCAVLMTKDAKDDDSFTSLTRGIADAATMACLTCILFHNSKPDENLVHQPDKEATVPHPKRQWVVGNDYFLRSLIICAGRRHALGIDGSGCQNKNRILAKRASSFADWDILDESDHNAAEGEGTAGLSGEEIDKEASSGDADTTSTANNKKKVLLSSGKPSIQDFQNVLRPMITFYAIMNKLSAEFSVEADDEQIAESAQRLEIVIISCQKSKNINELLQKAELPCMGHDDIIDLLQKGMVVAG